MRWCVMRDSDNLRTSKYWLDRAEECRALAESFHKQDTRERMLSETEFAVSAPSGCSG
jgi:hypothetical protein